MSSWGQSEALVFKISRLEAEEEDHFKILRDFKAPLINELLTDEAFFNAELSQANPRVSTIVIHLSCFFLLGF